jgi:hypothetical protein
MFEFDLQNICYWGIIMVILYFVKQYFNGGVCKYSADLSDQIIIITGANSGIGKETARVLGKDILLKKISIEMIIYI